MARILVVDDDPDIRETLIKLLGVAGYEVEGASDGAIALERLSEGGVDLMITDIVMPNQDGLEIIMEARKTHSDLPVIAMSSGGMVGDGNYLRVAKAMGAVEIFQKPFSAQDMLSKVREVLGED